MALRTHDLPVWMSHRIAKFMTAWEGKSPSLPSRPLVFFEMHLASSNEMVMDTPVFHSRFHSRFAPGFTPDSRSNLIALHRTRSDRFPHSFNANIVQDLTRSHSIPLPTDRHFKARTEPSAQPSPRDRFPERECQSNSHFPRNIPTTFPNSFVR